MPRQERRRRDPPKHRRTPPRRTPPEHSDIWRGAMVAPVASPAIGSASTSGRPEGPATRTTTTSGTTWADAPGRRCRSPRRTATSGGLHGSEAPRPGVRRRNRRAPRGCMLTSAQLRSLGRVLNNPPKQIRDAAEAILLILLTGCRSGEILNLQWCDVKADRLALQEAKTGPRSVLLTDRALGLLAKRHADRARSSPWVFPSKRDPQRPRVALDCQWYALRAAAHLPDDIRIHDLRHTYASHAVMSGESLATTGKLLGHRRAASTERYAHLDAGHLERAADKMSNAIDGMMLWNGN